MGIEVTKDEADKKQFDSFGLKDEDPAKRYRWARERDINMAKHKYRGYDRVDSSSDKVRSVLTDSGRVKKGVEIDTAIRLGDMVLVSTSRENFDRMMKERNMTIDRQTRGVTASARRAIDQAAGERVSFEEHRKNDNMRGVSAREFDRISEEAERRKRG